jgi:hypothetical protein
MKAVVQVVATNVSFVETEFHELTFVATLRIITRSRNRSWSLAWP